MHGVASREDLKGHLTLCLTVKAERNDNTINPKQSNHPTPPEKKKKTLKAKKSHKGGCWVYIACSANSLNLVEVAVRVYTEIQCHLGCNTGNSIFFLLSPPFFFALMHLTELQCKSMAV